MDDKTKKIADLLESLATDMKNNKAFLRRVTSDPYSRSIHIATIDGDDMTTDIFIESLRCDIGKISEFVVKIEQLKEDFYDAFPV